MTGKIPTLFIDGTFRVADRSEPVLEAATGELLGDGPSATKADIDAAVAAEFGYLDHLETHLRQQLRDEFFKLAGLHGQ